MSLDVADYFFISSIDWNRPLSSQFKCNFQEEKEASQKTKLSKTAGQVAASREQLSEFHQHSQEETQKNSKESDLNESACSADDVSSSNDENCEEIQNYQSHPINQKYEPQITFRYPEKNQENMTFPNFSPMQFVFPNDICFKHSKPSAPTSSFHSFVITEENGTKIYGFTAVVYKKLSGKIKEEFVKSVENWKSQNLTQSDWDYIQHLQKQLEQSNRRVEILNLELKSQTENSLELEESLYLELEKQTLFSRMLEPIQNSILLDLEYIYVPVGYGFTSHWPFYDFFRDWLAEFVSIMQNKSYDEDKIPLERLLTNILHEVPLPPSGKVEVSARIGRAELFLSRPPINKIPVLKNFSLLPLFKCLSPKNFVSVLEYVLTERKLLFLSSNPTILSYVIEGICTLVYPFSWHYILIPVLPERLCSYLQAPVPFIIGLTKETQITEDIPDDVITIDLDNNYIKSYASCPSIPNYERKKLIARLTKYANFEKISATAVLAKRERRKSVIGAGKAQNHHAFSNLAHQLFPLGKVYRTSASLVLEKTSRNPSAVNNNSENLSSSNLEKSSNESFAETEIKKPATGISVVIGKMQKTFSSLNATSPKGPPETIQEEQEAQGDKGSLKSPVNKDAPELNKKKSFFSILGKKLDRAESINASSNPKAVRFPAEAKRSDSTASFNTTSAKNERPGSVHSVTTSFLSTEMSEFSQDSPNSAPETIKCQGHSYLEGQYFSENFSNQAAIPKCDFCFSEFEDRDSILYCMSCGINIGRGCMALSELRPCSRYFNEKKIQSSVFKTFLSLLKHYKQGLIYSNKKIDDKADSELPEVWFDNQKFLSVLDKETRVFMSCIVETQAFTQFTLKRALESPQKDYELLFFDESMEAKLNRSVFRVNKAQTPFLDDESFDIRMTVTSLKPGLNVGASQTFESGEFPLKLNPLLFGTPRFIAPLISESDDSIMRSRTTEIIKKTLINQNRKKQDFSLWVKSKWKYFQTVGGGQVVSLGVISDEERRLQFSHRLEKVTGIIDSFEKSVISLLSTEQIIEAVDLLKRQHLELMNVADDQLVVTETEQEDLAQLYNRLFRIITIFEDHLSGFSPCHEDKKFNFETLKSEILPAEKLPPLPTLHSTDSLYTGKREFPSLDHLIRESSFSSKENQKQENGKPSKELQEFLSQEVQSFLES